MADNTGVPALLEYITSRDWAMEPNILQEMAAIIERHIAGERLPPEQIEAVTQIKRPSDERKYEITDDGRAVIPVSGVIAKYSRMVNGVSQPRGTSVEALRDQLASAVEDRRANSILLHIESPGGSIAGLADFAERVHQASFEKPVVAYIDDLGASAAYWIASQAGAIYANQTALVGSIGVYTLYMDSSKWAENKGIKMHILRSGQHKGVGSLGVAISDENLAAIQERVNAYFEMFVGAVLRGRRAAGLDDSTLRAIADGRVFVGAEAVRNKLIDGIDTLANVLAGDPPQARGLNESAALEAGKCKLKKEIIMTEKNDNQTEAAVKTDEIQQAAAAMERSRITAIQSALADETFAEVRNRAIADGSSLVEAKASAFDAAIAAHKGETAAMQAKIDEAEDRLKAIAEGGSAAKATAASDEGEETGTIAGDDGQAATFTAAAEKLQATGMAKGKAMRQAAVKFPNSHAAWMDEQPSIGSRRGR